MGHTSASWRTGSFECTRGVCLGEITDLVIGNGSEISSALDVHGFDVEVVQYTAPRAIR